MRRLAGVVLMVPLVAHAQTGEPPAPPAIAYDHARAPSISAVRAQVSPRIDGNLDDEVWRNAPKDTRSFMEESKSHGDPAADPVTIQVAYDRENLYIAARCEYATPRAPQDAPTFSEGAPLETITIAIDGEHDHSNSLNFALSPDGYRRDWESWNNGAEVNYQWSGLWEGATHRHPTFWTAEFAIPFGTLGVSSSAGLVGLGINFRRKVPPSWMVWALFPSTSTRPLPSFFGHVDGIRDVTPGQMVTLIPYGAVGYSPGLPGYRRDVRSTRLHDFDLDLTKFTPYAGIFGRVQPGLGFRGDFMVNPDFSQVSPDEALANLDRIELSFPEVREFFVEAAPVFSFGPDEYQLFYSRRIGLRPRQTGFDEVPILYGAKAMWRHEGATIAVLDVRNERLPGPVEFGTDSTVPAAHVSAVRARQVFGPSHVGAIFLNQTKPYDLSAFRTYGADGLLSVYDDHFRIGGFYARSDKLEPDIGLAGPAEREDPRYDPLHDDSWMVSAQWLSREFEARAGYLDVGTDFRADLGFYERTGIRQSDVAAFYRPQIHSDFVRAGSVGTSLVQIVSHDEDAPLVQKLNLLFDAIFLDRARVSVTVSQTSDRVVRTFYVAGHRLGIAPGTYAGAVSSFGIFSAPERPLYAGVQFLSGHYFGGIQRILSPELTYRRRWFGAKLTFQHYYLRPGPTAITAVADNPRDRYLQGDRLSGRLIFAPSPDLLFSFTVEANTLDPTATTQFLASWRLRALTNLSLLLNRSGPGVDVWVDEPAQQALVKLSVGLTPF